jgi:hypothetical protein
MNVTKLSLGLIFGDDIICLVDSFRRQRLPMKKDVIKLRQKSLQRQLLVLQNYWDRTHSQMVEFHSRGFFIWGQDTQIDLSNIMLPYPLDLHAGPERGEDPPMTRPLFVNIVVEGFCIYREDWADLQWLHSYKNELYHVYNRCRYPTACYEWTTEIWTIN